MDRGAWRATVHGDTTEHTHTYTTDNEWFAFLYTWPAERSQLLKNVHDIGGWHS